MSDTFEPWRFCRGIVEAAVNLERAADERGYGSQRMTLEMDKLARLKTADLSPHLLPVPLNMVLPCPRCGTPHVDRPDPANKWDNPPHRSHLCGFCGCIWRPADVPTNGVAAVLTRGQRDTPPEEVTAWASNTPWAENPLRVPNPGETERILADAIRSAVQLIHHRGEAFPPGTPPGEDLARVQTVLLGGLIGQKLATIPPDLAVWKTFPPDVVKDAPRVDDSGK